MKYVGSAYKKSDYCGYNNNYNTTNDRYRVWIAVPINTPTYKVPVISGWCCSSRHCIHASSHNVLNTARDLIHSTFIHYSIRGERWIILVLFSLYWLASLGIPRTYVFKLVTIPLSVDALRTDRRSVSYQEIFKWLVHVREIHVFSWRCWWWCAIGVLCSEMWKFRHFRYFVLLRWLVSGEGNWCAF